MAPRGVYARSTPGAAYLTISAGTRATSDPLVDGQQLALGEQAGGSSAGDIFERRTGVRPDGRYVALAWPTLQRVNAREPYDAELGLLTDTLADAGLGVEAIGNADGTDSVGTSYERQVGLAAATGDGVIPAGELDADLLVRDPSRAFGQRLDIDQVDQRFQRRLGDAGRPGRRPRRGRGVRPRPLDALPRPGRRRPLRRAASAGPGRHRRAGGPPARARSTPSATRCMLLAPYNLPGDRDLTVSALRAPGAGPRLPALGVHPAVGLPHPGRRGPHGARPARRRPARSRWRAARPRWWRRALARRAGRPAGGAQRGVALPRAARCSRRRWPSWSCSAWCARPPSWCSPAATRRGPGGSWPSPRWPTWRCCRCRSSPAAFPLEDLGAGFYWAFVVAGALVVAAAPTLVAAAARRRPRLGAGGGAGARAGRADAST